jgi:hypothetical protein
LTIHMNDASLLSLETVCSMLCERNFLQDTVGKINFLVFPANRIAQKGITLSHTGRLPTSIKKMEMMVTHFTN